jgi:hypothetical protein
MNKRIANILVAAVLAVATCGAALAQAKEEPPDRAVVPLSKPGQPAKVEVSVMRGSITVRAYEGKDIIVEARTREKALSGLAGYYGGRGAWAVVPPPAPPEPPVPAAAPAPAVGVTKEVEETLARTLADQERLARRVTGQAERARELYGQYVQDEKTRRDEKEKKIAGMKQLGGSSSGLAIEEQDNVVEISTQSWKAATDLVIQVPVTTSLEIRSNMDGSVAVEGVSGEVDVNNINGPVTVKNVSGNTLVHTVNGDIIVALTRVAADKPLSFSTMNGDIDVTLPADAKASLKMKSEQGEIYTDFDINLTRQPARSETPERSEQGKFRITFDKSLYGLVNGGGAEASFNTFSGDIFIRKRK